MDNTPLKNEEDMHSKENYLIRGHGLVQPKYFGNFVRIVMRPGSLYENVDLELALDLTEAKKNGDISDETVESIIEKAIRKGAEVPAVYETDRFVELLFSANGILYGIGEEELSKKVYNFVVERKHVRLVEKVKQEKGFGK